MFTEIDEKQGLVKVLWHHIRSRVANVEPEFAKIVDVLDPDQNYPLYLAYLPYGALKGDTQSTFYQLTIILTFASQTPMYLKMCGIILDMVKQAHLLV